MKPTAFTAGLLLAACLLAGDEKPNQPEELARNRRIYLQMREKIEARHRESARDFTGKYLKELEKIKTHYAKKGDLDSALAVDAEIKEVQAGNRAKKPDPVQKAFERPAAGEESHADTGNPKLKGLEEWADNNSRKTGSVEFRFEKGLSHVVSDFPGSRKLVKNRGFVIPTFDFEPQRGKILSPEFRTYADKLIVEVKGKAFVYACQGLRAHPDERKRLMKSFEAKGWTILDTFTTGSALDTGFIAVRPFSDETYTFEPIGAWRQLPALIFTSSSRKSGIAVKEKKK